MGILAVLAVIAGVFGDGALIQNHNWMLTGTATDGQVNLFAAEEIAITLSSFALSGALLALQTGKSTSACLWQLLAYVASLALTVFYCWLRAVGVAFGGSPANILANRIGLSLFLLLPLIGLVCGIVATILIHPDVARSQYEMVVGDDGSSQRVAETRNGDESK